MSVDLLFAYGTLMQPWSHPAARFLHTHSDYLGPAAIRGYLYDLGEYPGLIYDAESPTWVKGQLFRLKDPGQLLPYLDDYEGAVETDPDSGLYRKELLPVLHQQRQVSSWVYIYNQLRASDKLIPEGDYLAYVTDHKGFRRGA